MKKCKKLPVDSGAAELRLAHSVKMDRKKVEQFTRVPGFTPVRNAAVEAAIQTQIVLLNLENEKSKEIKRTPSEIEHSARVAVAAMLPKPRRGYYKHRIRPSKSDSRAYRKQAG